MFSSFALPNEFDAWVRPCFSFFFRLIFSKLCSFPFKKYGLENMWPFSVPLESRVDCLWKSYMFSCEVTTAYLADERRQLVLFEVLRKHLLPETHDIVDYKRTRLASPRHYILELLVLWLLESTLTSSYVFCKKVGINLLSTDFSGFLCLFPLFILFNLNY